MTCPAGLCIAGLIGGERVYEGNWDAKVAAFEKVIEEFDTNTRRFQVSHPGFVIRAQYCMNCGRKLNG